MGRTSSIKNFKRRLRARRDVGVADQQSEFTLLHLNCNGLSETSVYDLSQAATTLNANVICVTESHFRREQQIDHHDIEGFNKFEARRSSVAEDKGGGGLVVYCRSDGPIFRKHAPPIQNTQYMFVNNERLWVLCETRNCCVLHLYGVSI